MKRSYTNWSADVRFLSTWPLFTLNLLWCLGFAGASLVAIAVVLLATSHAAFFTLLPWAIGGAVLAVLAWRRALRALDDNEAPYGVGD